jgi:hypothetical protein
MNEKNRPILRLCSKVQSEPKPERKPPEPETWVNHGPFAVAQPVVPEPQDPESNVESHSLAPEVVEVTCVAAAAVHSYIRACCLRDIPDGLSKDSYPQLLKRFPYIGLWQMRRIIRRLTVDDDNHLFLGRVPARRQNGWWYTLEQGLFSDLTPCYAYDPAVAQRMGSIIAAII